MRVRELFCAVDDFCQTFEPLWHSHGLISGIKHRTHDRHLALSDIMTIRIPFHQSHYRTFLACSIAQVCAHLPSEFPALVSSTHFVAFFPSELLPLCGYLHTCLGTWSGISYHALTRPPWRFATIVAFSSIESFADEPLMAKRRSAGSLASSCMCFSMGKVRCSISRSRPVLSIIVSQFQRLPSASLASCLATRAIFHSHLRGSCLSSLVSYSSHHVARI